MSALEQEIIEKFRLLDKASKQRVLLQIEREAMLTATTSEVLLPISPEEWLAWAQDFGSHIHEKYGSFSVSSVDLLNEAREERLDDLMGGG